MLSAADVGTVSDDGKSVVASGVCSGVVLSCSCVCIVSSEDMLSLEVASIVVEGSLDALSVVAFSLEASSIELSSVELSSVDFSSVFSSVVSSSFASQTVSFSNKLLPYDASHAAGSAGRLPAGVQPDAAGQGYGADQQCGAGAVHYPVGAPGKLCRGPELFQPHHR